nr:uncharacterized protein LOC115268336 isoform X1 [Aedes albopictus]
MALRSILILILGIICTNDGVSASQKQKFCGPKLARALAELCDTYPTLSPPPSKRPSSNVKGNFPEMVLSGDSDPPDWPNVQDQSIDSRIYTVITLKDKPNWMKQFYPKHDTQNTVFDGDNDYGFSDEIISDRFMLGKRGMRRGIVEECCRAGCTYEYLYQNYCA